MEVEQLEDTELYMCGNCKTRQKSTKKFWIRRLPNVMQHTVLYSGCLCDLYYFVNTRDILRIWLLFCIIICGEVPVLSFLKYQKVLSICFAVSLFGSYIEHFVSVRMLLWHLLPLSDAVAIKSMHWSLKNREFFILGPSRLDAYAVQFKSAQFMETVTVNFWIIRRYPEWEEFCLRCGGTFGHL